MDDDSNLLPSDNIMPTMKSRNNNDDDSSSTISSSSDSSSSSESHDDSSSSDDDDSSASSTNDVEMNPSIIHQDSTNNTIPATVATTTTIQRPSPVQNPYRPSKVEPHASTATSAPRTDSTTSNNGTALSFQKKKKNEPTASVFPKTTASTSLVPPHRQEQKPQVPASTDDLLSCFFQDSTTTNNDNCGSSSSAFFDKHKPTVAASDLPIATSASQPSRKQQEQPAPSPAVNSTTTPDDFLSRLEHESSSIPQAQVINPQEILARRCCSNKNTPVSSKKQPVVVHLLTRQTRPNRPCLAVKQVFANNHHDGAAQDLFPFQQFNPMQSEMAYRVVNHNNSSPKNIVLSAPTGAGKTSIFEMAMARIILSSSSNQQEQQKMVYMAPSKALCQERFEDWSKRFGTRIHIAVLTGDTLDEQESAFATLASAQLILTTPEKWDSLSRTWTHHHFDLFAAVKLFMLDEVHLLGDASRGACLESIICRTKMIQEIVQADSYLFFLRLMSYYSFSHDTLPQPSILQSDLRIIAVSATLPNLADIASFLQANECFCFDDSYRPVPLTTHVVGLGNIIKGNTFLFNRSLNKHVSQILQRFSRNKPSICFCHTKKETEQLAVELAASNKNPKEPRALHTLAAKTKVVQLQKCLMGGFAYHHAGLDADDRKLVENAFVAGQISCLCATSTLAMGVNLPAHLVIIKGTSAWRGQGGHQDVDRAQLLQMMGRAGRPGFDTSGTAVIMTDHASKRRYEQVSSGLLSTVESQLPNSLVEVLNAEISQRVIGSVDQAMSWIKKTFFYRRVRTNPSHYGMLIRTPADLDAQLRDLVVQSIETLSRQGIVSITSNETVVPMHASHVMSQHMVDFDAMKRIECLPHDAGQLDLLQTLTEMEGLHRPVRRDEKRKLNNIHKMIRYQLPGPPSKIRIQTPQQKAFVLLQAAIGQHKFDDYTLRQEVSSVVEYATRMLTAAQEYSVDASKHGQVALQSLRLRRSLATSLWGAGKEGLVLNQLLGIGLNTAKKLKFNKILSFQDVLHTSAEDIEKAAARSGGFGKDLRVVVSKILKSTLTLTAKVENDKDSNHSKEIVCTFAKNTSYDALMESSASTGKDATANTRLVTYTLAVYTDRPGGCLLFQSNIAGPGEYRIPCPPEFGKVFVHAVSNLVGLDEYLELQGNAEAVKSKFTANPLKSKESKKPRNTSNASIDTKKMAPSHSQFRDCVKNVGDFRIKSKPPVKSKRSLFQGSKKTPAKGTHANGNSNLTVTPSPPPLSMAAGSANTTVERAPQPMATSTRTFNNNSNWSPPRNRTPPRSAARSTSSEAKPWKRAKTEQKNLQKRAFRTKSENPFAEYSFDPNDIEGTLFQAATKSQGEHIQQEAPSVIPPGTFESLRAAHQTPQYRHSSAPYGASGRVFNRAFNTGHRKRKGTGPRIPETELLHMKASEQERHAREQLQNSSRRHDSQQSGIFLKMRNARPSVFPQNHPFHDNVCVGSNMMEESLASPPRYNDSLGGSMVADEWGPPEPSYRNAQGNFQDERGAMPWYGYSLGAEPPKYGGNIANEPVYTGDSSTWDTFETQGDTFVGQENRPTGSQDEWHQSQPVVYRVPVETSRTPRGVVEPTRRSSFIEQQPNSQRSTRNLEEEKLLEAFF